MEAKAKRTLVKSAPELWELADDVTRMEAWMADLIGVTHPVPVEITDRDPERLLAWRAAGDGAVSPHARIALELAGSGFGTSVSITAQRPTPDPDRARAALEHLLDELVASERLPFTTA
jgi:hypothetical protein